MYGMIMGVFKQLLTLKLISDCARKAKKVLHVVFVDYVKACMIGNPRKSFLVCLRWEWFLPLINIFYDLQEALCETVILILMQMYTRVVQSTSYSLKRFS